MPGKYDDEVKSIFRRMMCIEELDGKPELALTFTEIIMKMRMIDRLDHLICMGIRHGLFGVSAGNDSSLLDLIGRFEESIEDLCSEIESMSEVIGQAK